MSVKKRVLSTLLVLALLLCMASMTAFAEQSANDVTVILELTNITHPDAAYAQAGDELAFALYLQGTGGKQGLLSMQIHIPIPAGIEVRSDLSNFTNGEILTKDAPFQNSGGGYYTLERSNTGSMITLLVTPGDAQTLYPCSNPQRSSDYAPNLLPATRQALLTGTVKVAGDLSGLGSEIKFENLRAIIAIGHCMADTSKGETCTQGDPMRAANVTFDTTAAVIRFAPAPLPTPGSGGAGPAGSAADNSYPRSPKTSSQNPAAACCKIAVPALLGACLCAKKRRSC